MKRIEIVIIMYLVLITWYMILSTDSVIWNCIYYIVQDALIAMLIIELFKQKYISKHLIWCGLVFTIEHAFIYVSLTAKDYISYYNIITSKTVVAFLVLSIAATGLCVNLYERRK